MLIVGGCSSARLLVDTPNVFSQNNSFPNDEVPPHLKSPRADLFYITDRQLGEDGSYSINRSASMAFGSVPVTYGNQLTWPELSKISATAKRDKKVNLTLGQTNELIRFPDTPLPFELKNGQPTTLPEAAQNYSNKIQQFQNRLAKELSRANRREVVLFVHGSLDASVFRFFTHGQQAMAAYPVISKTANPAIIRYSILKKQSACSPQRQGWRKFTLLLTVEEQM